MSNGKTRKIHLEMHTHHTRLILSMGGHSMASLAPSSSARQAVIAGEMHLLDPPGRLVNCQLQTSMDAMFLHLAVLDFCLNLLLEFCLNIVHVIWRVPSMDVAKFLCTDW